MLGINQLVVVAREDSTLPLDFSEALTDPSVRQIAVVNPNTHLLGFLTRQALTNLQMLPYHGPQPLAQPEAPETINLESKLLVLDTDDDVTKAVEDGRAQVGITYSTYAVADKNMRILSSAPPRTYDMIAYNVAILRGAPNLDEAWNFLNYLRSAAARAILQRDGVLVE
jgi:ABC-type molybdate transport system substrate-binding protein